MKGRPDIYVDCSGSINFETLVNTVWTHCQAQLADGCSPAVWLSILALDQNTAACDLTQMHDERSSSGWGPTRTPSRSVTREQMLCRAGLLTVAKDGTAEFVPMSGDSTQPLQAHNDVSKREQEVHTDQA
jgi:hypothetical protein